MRSMLASLFVAAAVAVPQFAAAQSAPDRPFTSRIEVSLFPAGALVATEGTAAGQPAFGSFAPTVSMAVALTPRVSLEGEVGGAIGVRQRLDFSGGSFGDATSPSMVNASGSLIVNLLPAGSRFVPYVAGGAGAVTLLKTDALGIEDRSTSFAGNVGGGLKVMFGRWGVRGDYRLFLIDPRSDSPTFLGSDTRYAHRVTGGLVFALGEVNSTR